MRDPFLIDSPRVASFIERHASARAAPSAEQVRMTAFISVRLTSSRANAAPSSQTSGNRLDLRDLHVKRALNVVLRICSSARSDWTTGCASARCSSIGV